MYPNYIDDFGYSPVVPENRKSRFRELGDVVLSNVSFGFYSLGKKIDELREKYFTK